MVATIEQTCHNGSDNRNIQERLRILLIDDTDYKSMTMLHELKKYGYMVEARVADDRYQIEIIAQSWDVVVFNYELSGINVFEALRKIQTVLLVKPVIIVLGVADDSVGFDLITAGVRDYLHKDDLSHLPYVIHRELCRERMIGNYVAGPDCDNPGSAQYTLTQLIKAWSLTSEKAIPTFIGHQHRVAKLAVDIARDLYYSTDRLQALFSAAMLHDIGRSWQPCDLWESRKSLTTGEWELVKKHPEISYTVLRTIPFPWAIAEMVYQHHERLDGTGYPRQLGTDDILQEAKILAVADTVDAMLTPRGYRPGFAMPLVLATMETEAGTHYDPDIVAICRSLFEKGRLSI